MLLSGCGSGVVKCLQDLSDHFNILYIPLLGGCYGKSCKLNGQHTRARNHSAISPCGYCTPQVIAPGPGLMIFITALSKCNRI